VQGRFALLSHPNLVLSTGDWVLLIWLKNSNGNTQDSKTRSTTFGSTFDAGKLRSQLTDVEKQAADPNLWSNPQKSQQVMREKKRLEHVLATEADLVRRSDDIAAYLDLAHEGENVDADLRREIDLLRQLVDRLETETLLSGENDARNAIVTIHPGAGGTESQDWADMLLRMYLRWAERQGFQTILYDYQPGEEAEVEWSEAVIDFPSGQQPGQLFQRRAC